MLRFPNPGSTLTNFVAVYTAAFEQYRGHVVDLDDLVQATVNANLATSSGHMGQEAIKRSTRKDRSRDGLYNQLKMYTELFRSLGWLRSTEDVALNYTFTLLGEQVVAAGRQWKPLLEEGVLGIAYPSHVLDLKGAHDIRPFSAILQTMLACNDGLSRDEMIVGPLSAPTDRSKQDIAALATKIMSLRDKPESISSALKELSAQRGIQTNTLRNYTRWPLAVFRDLGWTEKEKEPYSGAKRKFELHRLTPRGKEQALRLRDAVDLRIDQVEPLSFEEKRALSRHAHFAMLERAGFELDRVAEQIKKDEELVRRALRKLELPEGKPLLFSPFQSLSIAESSAFFPTPEATSKERRVEAILDGTEVGRGSRDHLFVKPKFETTALDDQTDELKALRTELEQLRKRSKSLKDAGSTFAKSRRHDKQSEFYPLIPQLFGLMGFKSDYSRAGVNYQRWDAWVSLQNSAVPIEIKSPTEEVYLSTKAIRQAIENKVILLARGGLKTNPDFSTLVVGYQIPNERGDMSMLIDDVHAAFGFKIGVLDLQTLALLAIKSVTEGISVKEEQLSHLKGFLDV
ncbi:hypothetical protein [Ruegeria arenilitoris]|uniref:hypothetical protein n=1 Tax=Ruegeria arenilitoris TaxID=1173585 RepID=UPI001481990B|nr:hypothetical protein [Ruegeria arenilitoris]